MISNRTKGAAHEKAVADYYKSKGYEVDYLYVSTGAQKMGDRKPVTITVDECPDARAEAIELVRKAWAPRPPKPPKDGFYWTTEATIVDPCWRECLDQSCGDPCDLRKVRSSCLKCAAGAQEAAEKAVAEQAERERLAREAAEAAERKHRVLLTELKADSGVPQLELKIENDPNVVQIPDGARFAGIPGNDELKLKLGDPERLARGGRVVDCVQTRQVYERMSAGLPMQREQLAKYEQQIRNATQERPAISEEARSLAIQTAYSEARNIAKSAAVVRARLGSMKLDGFPPEKRAEWMRSLKDWDNLHDQIDKLPTAYIAGAQYGEDLPDLGKTLQERALRLNKLVVDSGLAESVGEELATYGFGPAGAIAFRAAKFGIDAAYVSGKHVLNEAEIAQARATYDHLRSQYSQAEEKVNNAREDLAQLCSARS